MKISIVTPSLNQGCHIGDTIKSVINQTYSDYEYIVADGGSTDNTHEVLESYEDKIAKIIIGDDDGQADAINKGFMFTTGDVYAYLNSDDYYFRNTLEQVADYFNKHPEVDVLYGDCVFTDEHGQFIRYFSEISDFDTDRLFNYSDILMQPATFWRSSVFKRYGPFDKNLHYAFDWAFWCELASKGCNIRRMPAVLAANRVYPSTKTLSGSDARLDEIKRINRQYKTRMLLHAYYRYSLSDLDVKQVWTLLDYVRLPLLVLLSYGNIFHHFSSYHEKVINGFLPRSRATLRNASIIMPRLSYGSIRLEISADSDAGQSVKVYSAGKTVGEYQFSGGSLSLDIKLEEDGSDVDVRLEFEKEYLQYSSVLKRLVFFYKPKYIAAKITTILMY